MNRPLINWSLKNSLAIPGENWTLNLRSIGLHCKSVIS